MNWRERPNIKCINGPITVSVVGNHCPTNALYVEAKNGTKIHVLYQQYLSMLGCGKRYFFVISDVKQTCISVSITKKTWQNQSPH